MNSLDDSPITSDSAADKLSALKNALKAHASAVSKCPITASILAPTRCPVCGATAQDNCGKQVKAAYDLIEFVRAISKATGGES